MAKAKAKPKSAKTAKPAKRKQSTKRRQPTKPVSRKKLPGEIGNNANPEGGRAHSSEKRVTMTKLLDAIERVEKETSKNLFDHFVEKAFKNDTVLVALMKKLTPDLKAIESLIMEAPVDDATALAIQRKLRERFRLNQYENHSNEQELK